MSLHPDCLIEVARAIGSTPTAKEAQSIVDGVGQWMRELARRDPQGWAKMSRDERLRAAAAAAEQDAVARAEKLAQRKAANLLAQSRETTRLAERADQLKARGSKQAFHDALFERMGQLDNSINGLRNEILSELMDAVHAVEGKFWNLMDDPEKVRAFAKAVLDGDTSDPAMTKAAKAYTDTFEMIRERMNAAGTDIGKLDYGYLPQPHDTGKVARTKPEDWAAFILPRLRRDRYVSADGQPMSDAEVLDLLRSAHTTIATEGVNKMEPGKAMGGSRASRHDDAHRAIHFKDADAYLEYMREYGRGSMLEAISGHVGMAAKDIALMEEWGSNPNQTFRLLKDTAQAGDTKLAGKKVQGKRAGKFGPTLDMMWDTLSGVTAQPVSARLAQVGQDVRNLTVAMKLQGTLLSSVTDVPLQVLVAKSSGVPFGQAMKSVFAGFGKDAQRVAHELALGTDEIAGEMSRWHDGNLSSRWSSKLANTTMRLGLVEGWTNGLRRGFSLTYAGTLERMRKTDWDRLREFDRRQLEESGVTPDDWAIWQLAEPTEFKGAQLLTKNGIRDIPVEKLDALLGGDLAKVRDDADAQIAKLDERNAQETEWLDKRRAGYAQAQKDAAAAIEKLRASKDAKLSEAADILDIQAQLLKSQLDLATVAYADGGMSSRGYGRREGATQQRAQQLEARLREMKSKAGQDVAARAEREGAKLAELRQELDAFTKRASERMARRDAVMAKIARGVDPALDRVRDAAVNRAVMRLLGHMDAMAKLAVLAPDLRVRATLQQGSKAGTIGGEALRTLMLFKSFPLAVFDKHLRRIRSIPSTSGRIAYSVSMLTSLTLFGALALQLKDIFAGKDPRDMTTGKFWTAAFMQGGGFGIFGDMLYTGMGGNARGGQANWTSMAGPVYGTAFDFLDVTLGNAYKAAQGKDTDFGADVLRFGKNNAPLINLWYLRAAIDHMLLHDMQEAVSPGYLSRMKQRSRKEWGQGYWWEPGEALPDRAPDLEAAAGGN